MNNIKRRAVYTVILIFLLCGGILTYTVRYFVKGSQWAEFSGNQHLYTDGVLVSGCVYDRYDNLLAGVEDGKRVFADGEDLRRSVVHIVGDPNGNIGTGVLSEFASEIGGYNIINGVYSRTGKGGNLYLTIDSGLCKTAYESLDGNDGAAIFYNYKTGEVICMVSAPGIDPAHEDEDDSKKDGVFINRTISSTFTPGSVFKIITTAAALENCDNILNTEFECDGSVTIEGDEINCTGDHGTMKLYDAFANSCNCAYAKIAEMVGSDTLKKYADKCGLTESMSINGIKTTAGSFETAADGSANLAWAGIGQYNDLVNPASLMRLSGAVANGGSGVTPTIISRITSSSGIPIGDYSSTESKQLFDESTAATLKKMMRYNVTSHYGEDTFPGLKICAKTGTAEVGDGNSHSWFTGFLDDTAHPYAFAVVVENAGSGIGAAASLTNAVLQDAVNGD